MKKSHEEKKEFTLEIKGNSIFCSRTPQTPEEVSRFYAAVIKVKSQLTDDLAKDAIEKGIKVKEDSVSYTDILLTEYDRTVLLDILEEHVSEYGSKSWPTDTKNSIKNIFKQLKADAETLRYIGGILK